MTPEWQARGLYEELSIDTGRPRRKRPLSSARAFGEASVEQRMNAFGAFGEPLQHIINAYAYGDVWSRAEPLLGVKSLKL